MEFEYSYVTLLPDDLGTVACGFIISRSALVPPRGIFAHFSLADFSVDCNKIHPLLK